VSSAHEEGGERIFSVSTERFSGDEGGHVARLHAVSVEAALSNGRLEVRRIPDTEFELDVDLVLLAMGFTGTERQPLLSDLGVQLTDQDTVWRDANWMTSVPASSRPAICGEASRSSSGRLPRAGRPRAASTRT